MSVVELRLLKFSEVNKTKFSCYFFKEVMRGIIIYYNEEFDPGSG